MARKTELDYLNDKVTILEQQITNFENEKFQHELTVKDAVAQMKDAKANNQLRVDASRAKSAIAVLDRRIEVRQEELDKLNAEIEKQTGNIEE